MRLLELEIYNVRGIPHLLLKPDGKNIVIWGPNGAGKSAVVDAVDFLLTGKISRLMGKGTGGISLAEHGAHVDHTPEEARVRAVLRIPGVAEPLQVERCMGKPNTLECDKKAEGHLQPILDMARRGQHVLTRREILKYITADAGTRAQEIQALLNVSEIEDIRTALVSARNKLKTECESAKKALDRSKGVVSATIQERTYSEEAVLNFVNERRKVLGGQPIASIKANTLRQGLAALASLPSNEAVNTAMFEHDVQNVQRAISGPDQIQLAKDDTELRALLTKVRADVQLRRELSRQQLTRLGLSLIDESGDCPLCDKTWPPGELREYLENRLRTAEVATQHCQEIERLSSNMLVSVNSTIASLQNIVGDAQKAAVEARQIQPLQGWITDLQRLRTSLENALDAYPGDFTLQQVKQLLAPTDVAQVLPQILSSVQAKYPKTTPEQTAWEMLIRLEENLKALEKAQAEFEAAELSQKRADKLLSSFEKARDSVLGKLYDEISDRFSKLYLGLHGSDESSFKAKIQPRGAGLDFEVDFFGRGVHPPHALHSEGHQDSMGLCLYLALAERLTEGLIDLTILDDVVMSIDADHRRQICNLLTSVFPNKQFLITTHDRTWATQLRYEGVVTSRDSFEFSRWTIDTGPLVSCEVGLWDLIEQDLQKGDVPNAAFRLRRGSEHFFEMACDTLQADVRYRSDGRWELGNFLPAAISQYTHWLKEAKAAAQSWGNQELFEELQERDTVRKQIVSRVNEEWWAVNSSVHYNKWADFSEGDFRPVTDVFRDLCSLFQCGKCGGMLYLACTGPTPVSVQCNCAKVTWPLKRKKND